MTDSIIPEDFNLKEALAQQSTTPPEMRKRCPVCYHTDISRKSKNPQGPRKYDDGYYCSACSTHFDEPAYAADPEKKIEEAREERQQ